METTTVSTQSRAKVAADHQEGPVAKYIEDQTAKLPSDIFLWASLGAMGTAFALKLLGKSHTALFVGQWAAPFLLLGIYNKLVKQQGHDNLDKVKTDKSLKNA